MRRGLLLAVLAVAFVAHPALAQKTTYPARSADMMRSAERVEAAVPVGVEKQYAAIDTLRNFDFGGSAITWFWNVAAPDSGFVHGTNFFEDKAKATALALPGGITQGQVQEVIVWFGYKRDGLTTQTYAIEILEGTADSGPTNVLYRQEFMMADINADTDTGEIAPTLHVLTDPVTVGATFFVSVDFGTYGEADWGNAAIVASDLPDPPQRIPEEWEKWSDNQWFAISDAWFANGDNGWRLWIEAVVDTDPPTATEDAAELPRAYTLVQNYPNPFASTTTLQIELPARAAVRLEVIDLLGRTVATLVDRTMEAGRHTARFDAGRLPPGIYLARLSAGATTMTRKMVLVR